MSIYLLLLFFAVLTVTAHMLFKGDFVHPGFVVPVVFFFSTLCAIYNIDKWSVDLSQETVSILGSGVVLYFVVSFLVYYLTILGKKYHFHKTDLKPINISMPILVFIILFELVSSFLYLREVLHIAGGGFGNIAASLGRYKQLTHFSQENEGVGGIVVQLYQITSVFGLIVTYILINNILSKTGKKIRYIIPIILYAISALLGGNRLSLLRLVFFSLVIYFVLWHKIHGWNKTVKIKSIIKLLLIMVLVLSGFVGLRTVIGKTGRTVRLDPVYYITEYAGGSIQLFDLFIKNPGTKHDIFGYRTFYYINNFIGNITHASRLNYLYLYEFRKSGGFNIGNVYTGFRAFYEDFGLLGMYLCIIIHSAAFSYMYSRIRIRISQMHEVGMDLPLILFARMSYGYFFMSISFYSDYISPNFIKIIIFMIAGIFVFRIQFCGKYICIPRNLIRKRHLT